MREGGDIHIRVYEKTEGYERIYNWDGEREVRQNR